MGHRISQESLVGAVLVGAVLVSTLDQGVVSIGQALSLPSVILPHVYTSVEVGSLQRASHRVVRLQDAGVM